MLLRFKLYLIFSLIGFSVKAQFLLSDFLKEKKSLEKKVNQVFDSLSEDERIAQMIFTSIGDLGQPLEYTQHLVDYGMVGGIVLLNNTKEEHFKTITKINRRAQKNQKVHPIFALDAEPSLFNRRMQNSISVLKTNQIKDTLDSYLTAISISNELKEVGFQMNFSPVVDISEDNEAIGFRSYGSDPEQVISLSNAFVNASQDCQIVNVAKHFPGHGLISGDTHKDLVYIDGPLPESENYIDIIKNGVLGVMIGHIGIKNNDKYDTGGLPASCSRNIVTDLLKEHLSFKGLAITDAMNMRAVTKIEKSSMLASIAGCDIILMPEDELLVIENIKSQMLIDPIYREQVYKSVKKVLRLKFCLGLLK